MNAQEKLDFSVLYRDLARSIEEIIYCTIHSALVGPHRREVAIETFAEINVKLEEMRSR